jgi:hypothetical protein
LDTSSGTVGAVKLAEMTAGQLYFYYEGFGALLAVVADAAGLSLKPDGLFYRPSKNRTFLVSNVPDVILRVLRYDVSRFESGFTCAAELFEYLQSSECYNSRRFFPRARHPHQVLNSRKFSLYRQFEATLKARSPVWEHWQPAKTSPVEPDKWAAAQVPAVLLWAGPDFLDRYQHGRTVERETTPDERAARKKQATQAEEARARLAQEALNGTLSRPTIARLTGRSGSSARALVGAMRNELFGASWPENWEEKWTHHIANMAEQDLHAWVLVVHSRLKAS